MFVKPVELGRTQVRMMMLCVGVLQGQRTHSGHPGHSAHIQITEPL